jgi:hypothetical protein
MWLNFSCAKTDAVKTPIRGAEPMTSNVAILERDEVMRSFFLLDRLNVYLREKN